MEEILHKYNHRGLEKSYVAAFKRTHMVENSSVFDW